MKKITLPLFALVLAITACEKEDVGYTNIDTHIDLAIVNPDGIDLLSNGTIMESKVKTYHLIEGEFVEYFEGHLDAPRGLLFLEEKRDGHHYLRLFPSDKMVDKKSVTIIDWGLEGYPQDTLETRFSLSPNSMVFTSVALNGHEVWNVKTHSQGRKFTITK